MKNLYATKISFTSSKGFETHNSSFHCNSCINHGDKETKILIILSCLHVCLWLLNLFVNLYLLCSDILKHHIWWKFQSREVTSDLPSGVKIYMYLLLLSTRNVNWPCILKFCYWTYEKWGNKEWKETRSKLGKKKKKLILLEIVEYNEKELKQTFLEAEAFSKLRQLNPSVEVSIA